VVVDTNILFLVIRAGFPLEAEVDRVLPGSELLVPESVVAELEGLAKSLIPGAMAAQALAERCTVVPTRTRGDDGVIEAAVTTQSWVATADRELRRRLTLRGVTSLVPRDRHRLEVVHGRPAPPRKLGRSRRTVPPSGNG
jgi:rRNA-processing protein FCF1